MSLWCASLKRAWVWAGAMFLTMGALIITVGNGPVRAHSMEIPLRADLDSDRRLTFNMQGWDLPKAVCAYSELTQRELIPKKTSFCQRLDTVMCGRLTAWRLISPAPRIDSGVMFHGDGRLTAAELKTELERAFATNGLCPEGVGSDSWHLIMVSP